MKRKFILLVFLLVSVFGISATAQEKTVVNSPSARAMLVGRHKFAVQWIDFWKYFGAATVTNRDGVYYLKGEQRQRGGRDFVTIDGVITEIDAKEFKFNGKIVISVSYINQGTPCERSGEMTFKITGKRKYWRLQEMQSPCGVETDYVDIFFR
jgi:hypothetical protein